jgi:hypothetical protein
VTVVLPVNFSLPYADEAVHSAPEIQLYLSRAAIVDLYLPALSCCLAYSKFNSRSVGFSKICSNVISAAAF